MPPLGLPAESQPLRPEVEDGVKQSLWSPDSAAEKWNLPDEEPFWVKTRWSLSKISYKDSQNLFAGKSTR
jgi:hypothetical protein